MLCNPIAGVFIALDLQGLSLRVCEIAALDFSWE
jgi:hypothetical protein